MLVKRNEVERVFLRSFSPWLVRVSEVKISIPNRARKLTGMLEKPMKDQLQGRQ